MHIHGSQNAPRHFNYRSFYMTTHYSRCPAHSLSFDLYKNRPQAASMLAPFRLLESEDDRNEIRRNIRTHFSLNYTFLLFSLAFLKLKYNFFQTEVPSSWSRTRRRNEGLEGNQRHNFFSGAWNCPTSTSITTYHPFSFSPYFSLQTSPSE